MQHQPGADFVQDLREAKPDNCKGEKNPWDQYRDQHGPESSGRKIKILVIKTQPDTDKNERLSEFHALLSADFLKYFSRPMHACHQF